ncbi:MAG: flagellin, partial [Thermoguttaceae bacterium]
RKTRLEEMNHGFGVFDAQDPGSRAQAAFDWGANAQLILQARNAGAQWNDFRVHFVDSGGAAGSESVTWDQAAGTITVGIVPGSTTASQVVELFRSTAGPRDAFELALDKRQDATNNGSGLVQLGTETTAGGVAGGTDFVITRHDGTELEIDVAGLDTVDEILDAINGHAGNADGLLTARLATLGNGIELVDESLGQQTLQVRRTLLSTAAVDLGLVARGQQTTSAEYAGTVAEVTVDSGGPDNGLVFRATFPGSYANQYQVVFEDTGAESFLFDRVNKVLHFQIDTAGGTTAQDLVDLFQADPDASTLFAMELDPADGNDGSGVVAATDGLAPPTLTGGNPATLTGDDVNPSETEGIFTALLRLETALRAYDLPEIERSMAILDSSVIQLNYVRAELGSKQQGLDILSQRLDAEQIELKTVLSEEHDVDMVEVISNLTARQMALEAGMKATAQALQMTLLNYL